MRNTAGQLAVVVPWECADDDIKVHGGKVVTPIRFVACGLGGYAWETSPVLFDSFGNELGWDDGDLKPLGETPVLVAALADDDAEEADHVNDA